MNENHQTPEAREIHEAQLTAYALGQLNAKEREAAEALLARSAEARQFVEETKSLAAHIKEAYQQSPAPQASPSLRNAIEKQLQALAQPEPATPSTLSPRQHSWLRRHWIECAAVGACACLLVGSLLPTIQSARQYSRTPEQIIASRARSQTELDTVQEAASSAPNASYAPKPQSYILSKNVSSQKKRGLKEVSEATTLDSIDDLEEVPDSEEINSTISSYHQLRTRTLLGRYGGSKREVPKMIEESEKYPQPLAKRSCPITSGDSQELAEKMQNDPVILGYRFTRDSEFAEGPSPSAPGTEQYNQTI